MLTDDYLMRQIQMLEQLAVRAVGGTPADVEEMSAELDAAYRELLGVDPTLAARMSTDTLRSLLPDPNATHPLALLFLANGDVERGKGAESAARSLYVRALSLLDENQESADAEAVAELRETLEARLAA